MIQELTKAWVRQRLPKRPETAHKGTFGKVLAIAGSENYPGAAYLSSAAAYRAGAGLVTLATDEEVKIIVSRKLPEVTFLDLSEISQNISKYDVLLIGPGLGNHTKIPTEILLVDKRKVIDADGLNFLYEIGNWHKKIKGEIVLTPHAGEMARLTGKSMQEIQSDRINVAQYWAKRWGTVIVLKGAETVIASPAGETIISPFANPLLSTAGTGDVLAGIIAGLAAQGMKIFDAAAAGVYIHGAAGEALRERIGEAGLLASDLLQEIPLILKKLR